MILPRSGGKSRGRKREIKKPGGRETPATLPHQGDLQLEQSSCLISFPVAIIKYSVESNLKRSWLSRLTIPCYSLSC